MACRLALLGALFVFLGVGAAVAAEPVKPRAGLVLRGEIQFPRAQSMQIRTGAKDGSRLTVQLGFHGKCRGGGLSEMWHSGIAAAPRVRVRDGRFEATLTGVAGDLGGVADRSGHFEWTLRGRFLKRNLAVATVSGTAQIRVKGRTVSRCKTHRTASVRLRAA